MASVELANVSKQFPTAKGSFAALRDFSLSVGDREMLTVVGPSGSGKTTLLRLIAGLEEPTTGTISIDGEVVNKRAPEDRDVAMVFQNYALYPHMTVLENLAFGLKLRKTPGREIEQRVSEAVELMGLKDCLDRLPSALSGGERQRVALARAMMRKPRLLLLDEPLSNLDAPLRLKMRREMARLHRILNTTIIYVTHDQTEALSLGDRVAVLNAGMIQQMGPPKTVYEHPANLFIAGFLGAPSMNLIRGRLSEEKGILYFRENGPSLPGALAIQFEIPSPLAPTLRVVADREVIFGFRPEDVSIRSPLLSGRPMPGSTIHFEATVDSVEYAGGESWLYAKGGNEQLIVRIPRDLQQASGERVGFELESANVRFFDPQTGLAIA